MWGMRAPVPDESLLTRLVEAASRRASLLGPVRRARLPGPRSGGVLAIVAGLVLAGGAATAMLVTRVEPGGEPSLPYGRDAPEADIGIHYETRPVVLATGRAPDGERFELVGLQQSYRGESELCIDVTFPARGEGHGCANDYYPAQGISSGRGYPTRVEGATPADTEQVMVHYRVRGRSGASEAALVHVDDPEVIEHIRADGPFGFYLAILPEGAENIVAEGLDEDGRHQWRAVFYPPPDYSRRKPPDFQGRSQLRG
jgi:hypothetical protein